MADEKKNSVKVEVVNEPKSANPAGKELLKKAAESPKVSAPAKDVAPAMLISTNDHPETVKYGSSVIQMSARSRQRVEDAGLLPAQLPQGIHIKKL